MSKQFLIDGFNLAFRSQHAFQGIPTSDGPTSGGFYIFLNVLKSLKKKFPDAHFSIAWDGGSNRRKAVFPAYKATRGTARLLLPLQDLKLCLTHANIEQLELPGEEADDILASRVDKAPDLCYIYTADKDLLQLVSNGRVVVITPKHGKNPEKAYDEEAVQIKYSVTPANLTCYFAFKGDSCDNIPGVSRIPERLIAVLTNKYHTPTEIYKHLAEETKLTDFQRQSLLNAQDQVILNYSLVSLVKDLNLSIITGTPNVEQFQAFLDKYSIKSIKAADFIEAFNNEGSSYRTGPGVVSESLFDFSELGIT